MMTIIFHVENEKSLKGVKIRWVREILKEIGGVKKQFEGGL